MDLASLEKAIEKSLQYYSRAAGNGPRRMDDTVVTVRELRESLIALREILRRDEPDEVKQARIRETFDVYQSTGSGREEHRSVYRLFRADHERIAEEDREIPISDLQGAG